MRYLPLILITCCLLSACKNHDHEHELGDAHAAMCTASLMSEQYDEADVVDQPGAKIGDLTRCPISSSVFRVTEDSPKVMQKGQAYYTCCPGCVDQLEQSFARRR